jgi:mannose-6-phosphate isomerase-like protein (cupin superfamily)
MNEVRPWGLYEILREKKDHKVKYIYVSSGQRLSYQKHKFRNEHWFIVSGNPIVTINGKKQTLHPGSYLSISAETLHRIEAQDEPVEFIEIQTGTYFGEDDIERIEDDYGR